MPAPHNTCSCKDRPSQPLNPMHRAWVRHRPPAHETFHATAPCFPPPTYTMRRASSVEWFAEECRRTTGDVLETVSPDRRMLTIKQPVRSLTGGGWASGVHMLGAVHCSYLCWRAYLLGRSLSTNSTPGAQRACAASLVPAGFSTQWWLWGRPASYRRSCCAWLLLTHGGCDALWHPAGGRGGRDHALELPYVHDHPQGGPCTRSGLHGE